MSFQTSSSTGERYIGINTFDVLCINPNAEQMNQFNIRADLVKNYVDDEKNQVRIDIWVTRKELPFPVKLNFFISEPKKSKKNTWQYVDKYGRTTWGENLDALHDRDFTSETASGEKFQWFDVHSARTAFVGECGIGKNDMGLTEFMRFMLQVPLQREGRLDSIDSLFQGDFSELHSYVQMAKPVVLALGMENDKYYKIYSRCGASTYTRKGTSFDLTEPQNKIADHIKETQQYYLDNSKEDKVYYGEYPFNWSKYTIQSTTEENLAAPVVERLPF